MKKIIEVSSDEDGETYYVVGDVSRRTAWIAIRKFLQNECSLNPKYDDFPKQEDLEVRNFYYSESGEYEGYYWWGTPKDKNAKPVGIGWIYRI